VVDTIRKYFGEKVFETLIRDNVSLAEAPSQRQDIFNYNRSSIGATDYMNLCKEILARIEAGK
jgi:chromosome partitioning protein